VIKWKTSLTVAFQQQALVVHIQHVLKYGIETIGVDQANCQEFRLPRERVNAKSEHFHADRTFGTTFRQCTIGSVGSEIYPAATPPLSFLHTEELLSVLTHDVSPQTEIIRNRFVGHV